MYPKIDLQCLACLKPMRTTHDEGLRTRIGVVHLRAYFAHSFAPSQLRLSVARRSTGTPLGRLSGYHGAAAAAVPTGKLYPLVGSKPVARHDLAFWRMRVAPMRKAFTSTSHNCRCQCSPGMKSLCANPSEWTGTALTADVYSGSVRISRLKRPVQP
jgi:hypothetical protein